MANQGLQINSFSKKSIQEFTNTTNAPIIFWVRPFQVGLLALMVCAGSAGVIASSPMVMAGETGAAMTVAQIPASATVVYVNPLLGNDAIGAGSQATPYRTITYALSRATSGTVVQLARGSYTAQTGEVFPLMVPSGVILRGSESDKGQVVAIIGGGSYLSRTFARQNVTILADNNSEIAGVSVTNPNTRGTGIWVESTNPTIYNCTLTNNNREGIFITGTGNPKIEQNVFTLNQGNGISIASNAQGSIRSNIFQNTGFGLAIGGNSTPLIANNQITQNVSGIYINENARPVLRNNVIENNNQDGIVATTSAQPDLGTAQESGNNIIRNNRQYDLNNATSNTLYSVGNTLDAKKIAGRVEFIAPPIASGGTSAFQDVQGHWAQAYIDALAKRSVISGFPDGTFRPGDPVTRVQFAAIISKAFTPPPQQTAIAFKDVATSFWGYQAIQTTVQGGFMRGYPDNTFQSNQQIPRVQVLVALASGLGLKPNGTNELSKYQDATAIPTWAVDAVAAATQRKIVVNYPSLSQLNPNREATRGEVAAFVYQALVNAGKAEAIASPYIVVTP